MESLGDQEVPATSSPADAPAIVPMTSSESLVPMGAASSSSTADLASQAPPKYEDDDSIPPPAYPGLFHIPTTELIVLEEDDVIVEGHSVGSWLTFFSTFLVSWVFGVFGFLLSFMMSASHAGRDGAWAGLAIVGMQASIALRDNYVAIMYPDMSDSPSYDGVPEDIVTIPEYEYEGAENVAGPTDDEMTAVLITSYFVLALSWFIFVQSFFHYGRVRRVRDVVLATAGSS
mgnify:CR=1 FL=1